MRIQLFSWFVAGAAGLILAVPAFAGPGITAEYSAEEIIETEDGVTKSKVYSTPTMERREMSAGGQQMIAITRHDKKVMWNLMPEEKMFIAMPIGQSALKKEDKTDLSAYKIDQTPMGQETLNGVVMNKAKMIMTGKDGSKMGGFMWTTKEGILAKMDAISVEKDKKSRFKLEMANLKIGKQSADLFEVPKGYEKMDMGAMGAMEGMGDMGNMMKGMFGK
ncbi:hypothetical protein [Candidatus Nitrospira nitrificans]|uniref:DUF4412 domain-containing protein n=1 Tax=Candidatus Nitrospira nitrificans TaxID=1742973 RepID=A0A0S4LJ04_9BACT|nr:hypothetical protein [Candidatus Nitrospira nitrificans]CUS36560.1 conserved exported hypothetical protein [Candidatus Nitrospira nitrificans]